MSRAGAGGGAPILAPAPERDVEPLAEPPTFSVVVPVFEGASTIAEALASVLSQEPPPHELIVSDDGSRDDLAAVLEPFGDQVRVLRGPHRGVAAARNAGVRAAGGDFVLFADADDVLLPGKLAALGRLGRERPDLDLLATDMHFERDGRLTGSFGQVNPFPLSNQRATAFERCFVVQPAFRRSRLLEAGGFDESLRTAEDWDAVLRLVLGGSAAGLWDEPLAVYRIHAGSLTDARAETMRDRVRIMEKARAHPGLRPQERPLAERAVAAQRSRARLAEAQAAVAARSPDARRRCLRLAATRAADPRVRLRALAAAALPPPLSARAGAGLAGGSQLSRLLPGAGPERDDGDPAIAVIMAVRDGERFIGEALDSVLGDDFRDLELVVIDDGSTDATPRILAERASRDGRLVTRREEGETLAQVLNRGVGISRAPLLARLDADDVSLPGRLRAQVEFMRAHPEVVLLGGQALLVDEEGHEFGTASYPLEDAELRSALETVNPFVHSAVAMRREAFEAVGGYRENLRHAEDLDLWLRLSERGSLAGLPQPVVKYRIHGDQVSLRKQEDQAVHAAATRVSARARAAGAPDPLEGIGPDDLDTAFLVAHGVEEAEITKAVVNSATWLARTTGRAGYPDAAAQLFETAYEKARSASGSRELRASVHRSIASRHAEEGRKLRARIKYAQAALAERRRAA